MQGIIPVYLLFGGLFSQFISFLRKYKTRVSDCLKTDSLDSLTHGGVRGRGYSAPSYSISLSTFC